MGDDEWVRLKGGRLRLSDLAEQHPDLFDEYCTRRTFDSVHFKDDHPDLYRKYQSHSLYLKEVA